MWAAGAPPTVGVGAGGAQSCRHLHVRGLPVPAQGAVAGLLGGRREVGGLLVMRPALLAWGVQLFQPSLCAAKWSSLPLNLPTPRLACTFISPACPTSGAHPPGHTPIPFPLTLEVWVHIVHPPACPQADPGAAPSARGGAAARPWAVLVLPLGASTGACGEEGAAICTGCGFWDVATSTCTHAGSGLVLDSANICEHKPLSWEGKVPHQPCPPLACPEPAGTESVARGVKGTGR